MAEGIIYLDVDDEITSAAARIRSTTGTKVALVVPYGSRIATSRMNFRLLSREAVVSNRRLSIVAADAASRALAASAGLPVFATVMEYEAAIAGPRPTDDGDGAAPAAATVPPEAVAPAEGLAEEPAKPKAKPRSKRASKAAAIAPEAGAAVAADAAATAATAAASATGSAAGAASLAGSPEQAGISDDTTFIATPSAGDWAGEQDLSPQAPPGPPAVATVAPRVRTGAREPGRPVARRRSGREEAAAPTLGIGGRRIQTSIVAAAALAGLAVVVVAVAAYLVLPSASIALTPRQETIGPISVDVRADPGATAVDGAAGVVPAMRIDVPAQVSRAFTTTGKRVEQEASTGSVTFENYNFLSSNTIPGGSVVSTAGGVQFKTDRSITLPAAKFDIFADPQVTPSRGSVSVTAVKPGPESNVAANTIRKVPPGEDADVTRVNNANPTDGGSRNEFPQVSQAEVNAAVKALQTELATQFQTSIDAGAGAPPNATLFPTTAALGPTTSIPEPASLVGQEVPTFNLGLSANGTVIAVDATPVRAIAETRLLQRVGADHQLVAGSTDIQVGDGVVGADGVVRFTATARAKRVLIVDADSLRSLVKGRSAAEARTALSPYGDATVELWPSWVSTVTGFDARLTVRVVSAAGSVEPGGSPAASPAGSRSLGSPSNRSSAAPASSAGGSPASAAAP
jgi:hypothetical protein